MKMSTGDIRQDLQERMAALQEEIDRLEHEREEAEERLDETKVKLSALAVAYEHENERLGKSSLPLFRREGKSYRFAGMKVGDALKILKKENPKITKEQAYQILVKENFDFRGKRPKSALHFAWIALERSKKWRQK